MRSSEHWDHLHKALENPDTSQENALAKHAVLYHRGEAPKYKFSIVQCCSKPLQRQIHEGVEIRRAENSCDILMNSKLDHYAPAVGRVIISRTVRE